jgi:hypothetical protein
MRLSLPTDVADLAVETDVADRRAPFGGALSLDAFLPRSAGAYLAIADYCDGHLYPLTLDPFPRTWLGADRLDMPWFGVADGLAGPGYCAIIETSDDACVDVPVTRIAGARGRAPRIGWLPSMRSFAYPRRAIYRFVARGGYVALAQAYRSYAKRAGLLRTLAEKARRNPNVRRLYGAVDVWGDASATFSTQAHSLGVRRMLIHGSSTPDAMRRANALGYLTSDYDNYTDILPLEAGKTPDSSHDHLPGAAVQNADGTRMTAWQTYDKATQYMKRCPALWSDRARAVITGVLKRLPFLGRFIDVTTAEALYECHDPSHPLTRSDKRRCGEGLLRLVGELKLVTGGEHGIWWGVPYQSYIEGMMSSYQFAWPAGHLIRPKDRSEKFAGPYGCDTWENYDRWGIGHEYRVPLWQLVFHDCVVATWYWGDSNDFLLKAAPELTAKKDAFNILYGTMPMLWATRDGSWHADREAFLRTVHTTSGVHEAVAEAAMTDHRFLTPDRSVQRTRFSNGTVCIVNFGPRPHWVQLAGARSLLPQDGYLVRGPGIAQSREIRNGKTVTTVTAREWSYVDDGRAIVSLHRTAAGTVRVRVSGVRPSLPIARVEERLGALGVTDLQAINVYRLDADGARSKLIPDRRAVLGAGVYEVLAGAALRFPDLQVSAARLEGRAGHIQQGTTVVVTALLRNAGASPARSAYVAAYADSAITGRELARVRVTAAPRTSHAVRLRVPTSSIDGQRALCIVASSLGRDLCSADNAATVPIVVTPDPARWNRTAVLEIAQGSAEPDPRHIALRCVGKDVLGDSVRVSELLPAGERRCLAQWDALPEGPELVIAAPSEGQSTGPRVFRVAWNDSTRRGVPILAPLGVRLDRRTYALRGATYVCSVRDGVVRGVDVLDRGGRARPAITKIMASSAETGWVEEPGDILSRRILADGPVRTVVEVRKRLAAGVTYTKRFAFYEDGFDVEVKMRPPIGVSSRAYYAAGGEFLDSRGNTAKVDGQGDAEGVRDRQDAPLWYEVRGDGWAHSCVALTPFRSLTYWDSPEMGGIGFIAPRSESQTFAYRFHAGNLRPGFGATDYARTQTTPNARWRGERP